jgi:hypothetical protein
MGQIKNHIGERFGRLVVIEFAHMKNHKAWWLCQCDCGNTTTTSGVYLTGKTHKTRSCGCLLKEEERKNGKSCGRNNLLKYIETKRKPKGESSRNHLYYLYKYKSHNRGLSFDLSIEEFSFLTKGNCYYCGLEPQQIKMQKSSPYVYNGIDRVDNSKGYSKDNCVSCCKYCNSAKSTMTQNDFFSWVSRVYHHSLEQELIKEGLSSYGH